MELFFRRLVHKTAAKLKPYHGPDLLAEEGVRSLNNKKPRRRFEVPKKKQLLEGDEALFGIHPVSVALNAKKRSFHRLFIDDKGSTGNGENQFAIGNILELAQACNVEVARVSRPELDQMVGNASWNPHQGVVLDCSKLPVTLMSRDDQYAFPTGSIVPILVNIVDPMNVGAILRSTYFFGCKSAILNSDCSKLSPVVSKASSGAMENLQLHILARNQLLPYLKWIHTPEDRAKIVATSGEVNDSSDNETHRAEYLETFVKRLTLSKASTLFILLGNEGRGLPQQIIETADYRVAIPNYQEGAISTGKSDIPQNHLVPINSLNVSVATGIILYHCCTLFGHNKNEIRQISTEK